MCYSRSLPTVVKGFEVGDVEETHISIGDGKEAQCLVRDCVVRRLVFE